MPVLRTFPLNQSSTCQWLFLTMRRNSRKLVTRYAASTSSTRTITLSSTNLARDSWSKKFMYRTQLSPTLKSNPKLSPHSITTCSHRESSRGRNSCPRSPESINLHKLLIRRTLFIGMKIIKDSSSSLTVLISLAKLKWSSLIRKKPTRIK